MFVGILLAAGESKRFSPISENKLLYEIKPHLSVIETLLDAFLKSQIDKIVIVVGFQQERIVEKIQPLIEESNIEVETAYNSQYKTGGMSSSVIKGMECAIDASAVLITPGDIPFIPTDVIDRLIEYYLLNKPEIIVPTYNNRKGHPIMIKSTLFPEIMTISEEKRGLKEIMTKYQESITYLGTDAEGILSDIDTKGDLRKFS